jgi:hypothetical protein
MKMKNTLITLIAVVSASMAFAVEPVTPTVGLKNGTGAKKTTARKPLTPEDRARILAYTGGIVQQKTNSLGVVFVNLQERVSKEDLAHVPDAISQLFRIECMLKSKPGAGQAPMRAAMEELKNAKTGVAIVICDTPDFPALLVAPESRWALVNIAPLASDKPAPELLASRVQKEQWRAFAHVAGMANTSPTNCLMQTVQSPGDLDKLGKTPSIEAIAKLFPGINKLGIVPARMASYRKACEQGWAPAPTNDIQRAIYAEVKKTPAK